MKRDLNHICIDIEPRKILKYNTNFSYFTAHGNNKIIRF